MSDDPSFTFTPRDPGVPLDLWSALMVAVERGARDAGFELYFRKETGLGVVYVRRLESPESA